MTIRFKSVARVTHEEGQLRDARYWAARTMAERVIAGRELAENNLLPQVPHEPEKRTANIFRHVPFPRIAPRQSSTVEPE